MRPTLDDGDILLVRLREPGEPLAAGSVVVAQLPGDRGLGVKRIQARDADGWWLERDNPAYGSDSWLFGAVSDDAVRARVLARVWPHPRPLLASRMP